MRPPESDCVCTWGIRPLGMLDRINMGKGRVRLTTAKNCPVHDSCHGYTKQARASRPNGSMPYCPKHRGRNCPQPEAEGT